MKTWAIPALVCLLHLGAMATGLPVWFLNGTDQTKPLLFYISGDGGWNRFSTGLMQHLNRQGFTIVGMNARAYFRCRKTPEQAAQDVAGLLQRRTDWGRRGLVFIGYSFGADVMPFIQTRLPQSMLEHLKATLLLSPSEETDFETHLANVLPRKHQFAIPEEINRLTKPVTVFFGAGEAQHHVQALHTDSIRIVTLAGGHHYNYAFETLTAHLLENIPLR